MLQVHVPKEGVTVAFSPSGIRCPSRAQTADPAMGRAAAAGEPYADEALAFTRAHCLQRDVEVEVRLGLRWRNSYFGVWQPDEQPAALPDETLLSPAVLQR